MKLLTIKPVTIIQNGTLVERYEVRRSYTDSEIEQLNLPTIQRKPMELWKFNLLMEKRNAGVVVETFNSHENAKWFVASISLIKPVLEVLDACKEAYDKSGILEDAQGPNLMVRTPRNLDAAMAKIPENLLADIECDWVKRYNVK